MSSARFSRNGAIKPTELPHQERSHRVKALLESRLDQLNTLWAEVEEKLRNTQPPRLAFVRYNEEDMFDNEPGGHSCWELLGLVRCRGEWRLCHAYGNDIENDAQPTWKPLIECTVDERVAAVDQVALLREAIIESADRYTSEVESAVSKLSEVVARL
jgi:hypothetical protein